MPGVVCTDSMYFVQHSRSLYRQGVLSTGKVYSIGRVSAVLVASIGAELKLKKHLLTRLNRHNLVGDVFKQLCFN